MVSAELSKQLNTEGGKMSLEVDLSIEKGSFTALYGRSGAGKTSVLRMLAGLMQPDVGEIFVDGDCWTDTSKNLAKSSRYRKVGFVFQDYALFPNMSVQENLEYALVKGQHKSSIDPLIEMMELGDLRSSLPATLSGGQQQRVALARALVQRPVLLLLDEPLSALDWQIRQKLQGYIKLVHDEYKLTTIMVSHDVSEIWRLSDFAYVLEKGKVIRQGSPAETLASKYGVYGVFDKIAEVISIDADRAMLLIDQQCHWFTRNQLEGEEPQPGDRVLLSPRNGGIHIERIA